MTGDILVIVIWSVSVCLCMQLCKNIITMYNWYRYEAEESAVKHPTVYRAAPPNKESSGPKINSAKLRSTV